MREGGLDALIVLAPDGQSWLCGLESFISGVLPQGLVVPADDARATTLVVWDADEPLAHDAAVGAGVVVGGTYVVGEPGIEQLAGAGAGRPRHGLSQRPSSRHSGRVGGSEAAVV